MNPVVAVILVFAAVGFIDLTFGSKCGLAEDLRRGLAVIPTMLIASVGVSSVGITFLGAHTEAVSALLARLPFEPGVLVGAVLAPDLGGLPLCREIALTPAAFILNGAVLTSLLGQTVSFQIPVFMTSLDKSEHDVVIRGFLLGLGAVPAGFLAACLLVKLPAAACLKQFVPVLLLSLLIFIGLLKKTEMTVAAVKRLSTVITWIIYALFFVTMLGVFFPSLAYADVSLVAENTLAIVKSCSIAGGALVLAGLIRRFLPGPLKKAAAALGVNETAVIGLIVGMANSIAMLPLFPKMDRKGKLMNAAFSVSGAYLIGGQMGYISSLTDARTVTVYLIAKAVCGALSIVLALRLAPRFSGDLK